MGSQQLGHLGLADRARCRHECGHPVGVDLHPLAPNSHQLRLGGCGGLKPPQIGLVQLGVAKRGLPGEGHQGLQPEARPGDHARRAHRLGPQPEARPVGPPRGQQHRYPHLGQRLHPLGERQQPGRVQRERVRDGLVEHGCQLGRQPHSPAKLAEQLDHPVGTEQRPVLPQLGQGDQQGGLVGVLGQQLQPPLARRRSAGAWGRLVYPDRQANPGGMIGARSDPPIDPLGQRAHPFRVDAVGQSAVVSTQGFHPRMGHGPPAGPTWHQRVPAVGKPLPHLPVERPGQCQSRRTVPLGGVLHHERGDHVTVADGGQRPPLRPTSAVSTAGEGRDEPSGVHQRTRDRCRPFLVRQQPASAQVWAQRRR